MDTDGKIVEIEEKPENPRSCLRGCGIYIFDPCVFEFIENTPFTPPRNEKEITTTLKMMCEQAKVYGLSIDGANINVNTYEDLVKAAEIVKSKFGEKL
jgi:bifunctional UDP-N-acetylglucosamine pyrophosphorylase/glucosamine-1-phosphate N-acetyltransferase